MAAVLVWSALAAQLYILVHGFIAEGRGVFQAIVTFLSFFTVLTNLLVAIAFTAAALGRNRRGLFSRSTIWGGIAASILLVGITYSLALRHIWNPQGLQKFADVVMHDVSPILFLVFWWIWAPKTGMRWIDPLLWVIYPLLYLLYSLIRGAIVGRYPYPFIDLNQLSYPRTATNVGVVLIVFWALGYVLVGLARLRSPSRGLEADDLRVETLEKT
ncbi:MAG: Pr6Pr family membrane protein [Chthoniobacterales bacterium]|nr:Pr6Pr family membrane protein [Chthoniobacterales bacterium]